MTKLRRLRTAVATTSAVLAVAGSVLAAGAAAPSAGAATCSPKTDYEWGSPGSAGFWANWCGTGYRYPASLYEVRDATAPYHRIWVHNELGQAWCAWGPYDTAVPFAFDGIGGAGIANVLISANTNSC